MDTKRLISHFIELVKIYSPSLMEDFVFEYLFKKFRELGYISELQVNGKVKNMIVFIPGNSKEKPPMMFCAHADTVEPAKDINVVVDEVGGVIKSDGKTILGADDKAGVAAMLELAYHLKEEKNASYGDIYLVITSAEEIGLVGAKYLDLSKIKVKFGYCLDSHGDVGTAIIRGATHYRFKVECFGKSAHAGIDPEKGVNAIKMASDVISKIACGKIDEGTVVNIGEISGGKATNIIPDYVVFEGEVRSFEQSKIREIINDISDVSREVSESYGGEIKVSEEKLYSGYSISDDSEVVKRFIDACYQVGIKPIITITRGGSDANIFNENGIEVLNISCGMRNPHSLEEFIFIKDLLDTAKLSIALAVL